MTKDKDVLSLDELAGKLGLNRKTVSDMVEDKILPALKSSKRGSYRFYWPAVQEAMSKTGGTK